MTEKTPFNFEFNPNGIEADPEQNDMFRFGFDEDGLPYDYQKELFPDAEPRNEYEPLDPDKMPHVDAIDHDSPEYAARPAEERTRELFAYMHPHRMTLLGMLKAAKHPVSTERMDTVVKDLVHSKFNVYTAANLCTMLEKAGALARVAEDGAPYGEAKREPEIVVIDGEEYYKPTDPLPVFWLTTDAGQMMVAEDNPIGRMRDLLENEPDLAGIYKQILILGKDGATISTLSEKVDANPLISKPRRFFVQHFVEGLERCEAMEWRARRWTTTPVGDAILDMLLADVEPAQVFERTDRSKPTDRQTVPTETQGVNW